ncbi:MAG: CoA-binding protein [Candidatus Sericytochromatia bacterium]|uniref:CoA-binding protein n=1 Tax=Candidatus Tanganyikabacteria bacterium TaxID=2961651 RepID=A0A938BM40_9BACT|nr:CoA-binding protein [Candidatus Tanganyikabacteria bacterium]
MRDDIDTLINYRTWAVAGASNNPDKVGFDIFVTMRDAGYLVFPINPREPEIAGTKAYASVADLPVAPDVVDLVVPPGATLGVVKAAIERGTKGVWFQPGSESEEAVGEALRAGLIVVAGGPCAMTHRRRWVS